jgi:serine/threonine-protein kinase
VAIKILNDRYANDELFVERFRREAKSAAGLSHPNIVSIYDRGEAEGTYYIAMEVIEGKSLKEVIRGSKRLRPAQAIAYTRQILSALRFAHRNGIIHRDIKPHNILVGPEERLKVTDFGIARAGASQMTETGSIMGTAQYLSPEQARGAPVIAASDLYSVGIVLYEMLTGAVPFTGDSPVEIAMKHVGETPHPPSALAPGIPADLDRVVLRALAKNPADRYQSAEDFDSDLSLIEGGLPIARETADAATAILARTPPPANTEVLRRPETPRQPPRRPPPSDPYAQPPRRRRRSLFPWLLAALLLAGAAVAGWYVYQRVQDELTAREPVPVPNVVGLKQNRAINLIENAELEATVEEEFSDRPAGEVLDQDPNAGTKIQKGESVTITVSAGIEQVKVPKVVGKDVATAIQALDDAGLNAQTKPVFSQQPVNTVTKQNPKAGTEVDRDSTVVLNVSQGVQTVAVPDVLFQDQANAVAELEDAGLVANVQEVESDEQQGLVVDQDPDPDAEVDVGSTVTISVSLGPPPVVSVPSVLGLDEASAQAELESAGFSVEIVDETVFLPDNDGIVIAQDPGPGAEVDPSTTVTLVVARFILGDGGGDTGASATDTTTIG